MFIVTYQEWVNYSLTLQTTVHNKRNKYIHVPVTLSFSKGDFRGNMIPKTYSVSLAKMVFSISIILKQRGMFKCDDLLSFSPCTHAHG